MATFDQDQYDIRFAWGLEGARLFASVCDAIVLVDVLSFTTCVSIAVERGAVVYPYRWHARGRDSSAADFAASRNAILAGRRGDPGYSLSPVSLLKLPSSSCIVLPSANGSTISLSTGDTPTYAGCLRNSVAVARAAATHGKRIGVVACGERWKDEGTLRPAIEDEIGAGAIITGLSGRLSPEAELARSAFRTAYADLDRYLAECGSGRELSEGGYIEDVREAARCDVDRAAPVLRKGAYVASV